MFAKQRSEEGSAARTIKDFYRLISRRLIKRVFIDTSQESIRMANERTHT